MSPGSVWNKIAIAAMFLFLAFPTQAQWITQSFQLRSGWNAINLHVDASHDTLDNLVGNDPSIPIEEIWMWSPNASTAQFITNPQSPSQPAYWLNWVRVTSPSATLARLPGNVACLVRSSSDYTWNLKGKPVAPVYQWSGSGLNFFGFPTVPGAAPSFDSFLDPAADLKVSAEIFAYSGGPIANNPSQVFDLTTRNVRRGEAFWIRSGTANRFFGPLEVVASPTGIRFGATLGVASFRIRNNTAQDLTVTLTGVASEAPPTGQQTIQGPVPVLVRGDIDTTTLTHTHSVLASGPKQWTLKKIGQVGSVIEVVIGVDRQQMTAAAGGLYASVLRFTDSLNDTQIDVPVSAEVGSTAGLWVGNATVSSVNHYLNTYAKATNATQLTNVLTRLGLGEGVDGIHYEIDPATQRVLVFGGSSSKTGSYLLDGPARVDAGTVARPYQLRLIVHNDGSAVRLLQQAFHGIGLAKTPVITTKESLLLPSELASARRISAVHLPLASGNLPWSFAGTMQSGSSMSTTVEVSFNDQASNPFLHTYHPDHDNLDASFRNPFPSAGIESYGVRRQISLTFTAPGTDFSSLTRGSATLNGNYSETVTFLGKPGAQREYTARGSFTLNRISDITTLTQ